MVSFAGILASSLLLAAAVNASPVSIRYILSAAERYWEMKGIISYLS